MTATWVPKVAKLLPLLGSNVDGEVVAAARAIARALKSEGADLHDMVHALTNGAAPRRSADDIIRAARQPFTSADFMQQASAYAQRHAQADPAIVWFSKAALALMMKNLTSSEGQFLANQVERASRPGFHLSAITRGIVQGLLDQYGVTL